MIYKCMASRGECELADSCFNHNIAPGHGDYVRYFVSDRKGEHCPHYMRTPSGSDVEGAPV